MSLDTIIEDLHHTLMQNRYVTKQTMVNVIRIAGLGILVGAAFLGYRWYYMGRSQAAQKRLSEIITAYTQEVEKNHKENKETAQANTQNLSAIADLFAKGASEYADTSLAPFFLAYQAEVLLKEGNLESALGVMSQALTSMSPASELYPVYELKKVLMALDWAQLNNTQTHDAEQKLLAMAHDTTNKQRDMALFYAGRFYWSKGDVIRARELLQELISLSYVDKSVESPWTSKAESLIKQMGA